MLVQASSNARMGYKDLLAFGFGGHQTDVLWALDPPFLENSTSLKECLDDLTEGGPLGEMTRSELPKVDYFDPEDESNKTRFKAREQSISQIDAYAESQTAYLKNLNVAAANYKKGEGKEAGDKLEQLNAELTVALAPATASSPAAAAGPTSIFFSANRPASPRKFFHQAIQSIKNRQLHRSIRAEQQEILVEDKEGYFNGVLRFLISTAAGQSGQALLLEEVKALNEIQSLVLQNTNRTLLVAGTLVIAADITGGRKNPDTSPRLVLRKIVAGDENWLVKQIASMRPANEDEIRKEIQLLVAGSDNQ